MPLAFLSLSIFARGFSVKSFHHPADQILSSGMTLLIHSSDFHISTIPHSPADSFKLLFEWTEDSVEAGQKRRCQLLNAGFSSILEYLGRDFDDDGQVPVREALESLAFGKHNGEVLMNLCCFADPKEHF